MAHGVVSDRDAHRTLGTVPSDALAVNVRPGTRWQLFLTREGTDRKTHVKV